ncbi:MAG: hypothetical protein ABFS28_16675 [Bacteroidota bacterium]
MDKYLIEVPHGDDKASCMRAIQVFLRSGSHFVTNAEWGCMDGDHKAWLTVETETKDDAMRILPAAYRRNAKIVKLVKFKREDFELQDLMDHHA